MVTWKEPSRLRRGEMRRKFMASRSMDSAGEGAFSVVGDACACEAGSEEAGIPVCCEVRRILELSMKRMNAGIRAETFNRGIMYRLVPG